MKKVMTINYKLWERILSEINKEADLSKDNVIEKIRGKLERSLEEHNEWKEAEFCVNFLFEGVIDRFTDYHTGYHTRYCPPKNKGTVFVRFALLHFTIDKGYKKVAKALIDKDADINIKDESGSTPLHFAASLGYIDLAKILIDKGANVNEKDNDKKTPRDLANFYDHKDLANILIKEEKQQTFYKSLFTGGTIALLGTAAAVALFANGVIASAIMMVVATIVAIAVTHMMLKPNTEVKVNEREMHTPQYLTYSDPNPIGM